MLTEEETTREIENNVLEINDALPARRLATDIVQGGARPLEVPERQVVIGGLVITMWACVRLFIAAACSAYQFLQHQPDRSPVDDSELDSLFDEEPDPDIADTFNTDDIPPF